MEMPQEMLQSIFSYLRKSELQICRAVCRAWRAAVNDMPEVIWQEICSRESHFEDYVAARKKYGLSWRDTYIALNSWSGVGSAEMKTQVLNVVAQSFKILPNGIIAFAIYETEDPGNKSYAEYADTIVYYNLKTNQEIAREEFDFTFCCKNFEITKHFIVLLLEESSLCLVLRVNKKQFFVGATEHFTLIGTKVYFKANDENVYVSKLVKENGEYTIKTRRLGLIENEDYYEDFIHELPDDILDFSNTGGNVSALTYNGNLFIFNEAKKRFDNEGVFGCLSRTAFVALAKRGYDWKTPSVHNWVYLVKSKYDTTALDYNTQLYVHARTGRGMVIMIHSKSSGEVNIHRSKYPKGIEALDNSLKSVPIRVIEWKEKTKIIQTDVLETSTSHKVLLLGENGLHIYEFVVEPKELHSIIKKCLSNKAIPKKRPMTPNQQHEDEHYYNTRSRAKQ